MNYIWEVLLKARKDGLNPNRIHFHNADTPSPYKEIAMDDLNPQDFSEGYVEVNPLYRHSHIFQPMLDGAMDDTPELRDALFDILMHFLAQISLFEGMSKSEYFNRFLHRDLEKGHFGQQAGSIFATFSINQQWCISAHMVRMYTLGNSIFLLRSLLQTLYPLSMIYLDTTEQRELLIYIGKKCTSELENQLSFLLSLFVPLDLIVHLFWDMHFGIIDVKETMELDQFMIY